MSCLMIINASSVLPVITFNELITKTSCKHAKKQFAMIKEWKTFSEKYPDLENWSSLVVENSYGLERKKNLLVN